MKERLYHIDLLRFIAAIYVLIHHYGFRGHIKDDLSIISFPEIESMSKYGYLGVDLFFMISGFVILLTALKSNLIDFCISRISRLYPAYWVCVIITSIVIIFYGGERYSVTAEQILINLTMLNGFLGIKNVDGVYWSLLVELKFYFIVGFILFFNGAKHIKTLAPALLTIPILQLILPFSEAPMALKILYYFTFPEWISYFIAGMFFFMMKSEKQFIRNIVPLIICYAISLKYAFIKGAQQSEYYGVEFSNWTIAILITLFYAFMLLLSLEKLNFLNQKSFLALGVLTYPLYLIHQFIGYIIFNNLNNVTNKWLLLLIVTSLMLVSSYVINKLFEKPLGKYLRKSLTESPLIIRLKSKLSFIWS